MSLTGPTARHARWGSITFVCTYDEHADIINIRGAVRAIPPNGALVDVEGLGAFWLVEKREVAFGLIRYRAIPLTPPEVSP